MVEGICQQVKRWQGSDHRLRGVGSALLFAESRWNRIHGCRYMPVLLHALNAAYQLRCAHKHPGAQVAARAGAVWRSPLPISASRRAEMAEKRHSPSASRAGQAEPPVVAEQAVSSAREAACPNRSLPDRPSGSGPNCRPR